MNRFKLYYNNVLHNWTNSVVNTLFDFPVNVVIFIIIVIIIVTVIIIIIIIIFTIILVGSWRQ